jgi:hypothetical protein
MDNQLAVDEHVAELVIALKLAEQALDYSAAIAQHPMDKRMILSWRKQVQDAWVKVDPEDEI